MKQISVIGCIALTFVLGWLFGSRPYTHYQLATESLPFLYAEDSLDYVDLELPSGTLWGTRNLGSDVPADCGYYISWGEVCQKHYYLQENYKWYHKENDEYRVTKYGYFDKKFFLDKEDDAANIINGKNWRIPTENQFKELCDTTLCNWQLATALNRGGMSVTGYRVTSKKNGRSMFLPMSGYLDNYNPGLQHYNEDGGYYWTNSLDSFSRYGAEMMYFDSCKVTFGAQNRYNALAIRPVCSNEKNRK